MPKAERRIAAAAVHLRVLTRLRWKAFSEEVLNCLARRGK